MGSNFSIFRPVAHDQHPKRGGKAQNSQHVSIILCALAHAGRSWSSRRPSSTGSGSCRTGSTGFLWKEGRIRRDCEGERDSYCFKTKFTGNHVMKWTGLYGFAVRDVMRGVRERISNEGILSATQEEIEAVTREVQQELGLQASDNKNS